MTYLTNAKIKLLKANRDVVKVKDEQISYVYMAVITIVKQWFQVLSGIIKHIACIVKDGQILN